MNRGARWQPVALSLSLALLPLLGVAPADAQVKAPVTAAAFSPDFKQVVLGSQQGLEIRTWPELALQSNWPTELVNVHDLSFSPDGRQLLVAGGAPAESGGVEVLRWPGGERIRHVTGHTDLVYRVAWSPDGRQWATAGADGLCQVISADAGQRLVRYDSHSRAVLAVSFLPDGATVASAGVDQTLRLWDAKAGGHLRTLDNHVGSVNAIAVRPEPVSSAQPSPASPQPPPIVATISEDRTVRLWQPTIGRLVRFARLPSIPRALAWSGDGKLLYIGCNDGRILVVDPDSVQIVGTRNGLNGRIHELLIDPSSNQLLVAGEGGAKSIRPEQ